MSLLTVSHVSLQEGGVLALRDISFEQPAGQKLALAGETGAGKSTLLQTIAGLAQPTAGEVRFHGERVIGPHDKLVPGHPGIAYLSQQFELPKFLRVEQALRYADKLPAGQAARLYELCQIDHLLGRKTNELSGGERQRIALARLLLTAPRLLLLDEPFSNLDSAHKRTLKAVLREVSAELGVTYTLVSHDPLDTLSWADEILVLRAGQVMQRGTPEQIYRQPADEYVAALFGDYNLLRGGAMQAFVKAANLSPTGKQLLVRPESFTLLGLDAPEAVAGQVKAVRFFGSYSKLEVAIGRSRVTVKTTRRGLEPGVAVRLGLAAEDAWLL